MRIPKPNKTMIVGEKAPWWEPIGVGLALGITAALLGMYLGGHL